MINHQSGRHVLSDQVKVAAYGQWDMILQTLCGLTKKETTPAKVGMPCPNCGGHNRYEFKSVDDGYHLCRGCGAGDGFNMLMKLTPCSFPEAVNRVAGLLNVDPDMDPVNVAMLRAAQKNHMAAKAAQHEKEVQTQREKAKEKAQRLMKSSSAACCDHPYLLSKQLPVFDLKQRGECLLIPLYDESYDLINIESIAHDGRKSGLKGGSRQGVYYRFGDDSWTVYVCEGWATGASLYLMERQAIRVYAAMGKSNLIKVSRIAREQNPDSRLVLAADNDVHLPGNPGLNHALDAASVVGATVMMPPAIATNPRGTDFSDFYLANGGYSYGAL